jgi:hypothetical protein
MSVKPMTVTAPKTETIAMSPRGEKAFPPNFGAEAMIQWLHAQMRESNKDVQTTLKQVETDRAKLKSLSELQQTLRDLKASCRKEGEDIRADLNKDSLNLAQYQTDLALVTSLPKDKGGAFGDGTDPTVFKPPPTGGETSVKGVDKAALEKQDWYQALSPEGKAAVEKFITQLNPADGRVMEKQLDAVLDAVKDDISAINSNNELQMINLQHVMQTRNQAIQLSSNIISVIDRGADAAINNIGKG